MSSLRESRLAWVIVLAVVGVQLFALRHEPRITRVDLNDNVFHLTLAERMVEALEEGENPLDCWVAEWSFGYPVARTYQPLGHLFLVLLYRCLGKTVSLLTLFVWIRLLLICFFPVSLFLSARFLGLRPRAAAAAALLSPLVATNGLYGIEYGSYLWRGGGLYTQAWAMHLMALAVGVSFRAVQCGRGLVLAGALAGLTFLAHFIYGYMAALSIALLIAFSASHIPLAVRLLRVVSIGLFAFALTAFQILPLLADASTINRSRWEYAWKWDSFGGLEVLKLLTTGRLLDFERLPVLTFLALLGGLVCLLHVRRSRQGRDENHPAAIAPHQTCVYVLAAAVIWTLLFCGRPTWGVLFTLLGAPGQMQLHRLIGGVHFFSILLAGIGLAGIWGLFTGRHKRSRYVGVLLVSLLLLFPILRERAEFVSKGAQWGEENLAAFVTEEKVIDEVIEQVESSPGRVYAGLAAGWGSQLRVGSTPVYSFLSVHQIPALSFLFHAMALTGDIMVRFDERNFAHYRVFNVTTVVADEGSDLPSFLTPHRQVGRFRLLETPLSGYFEIVSVPYAVRCDRESFYEVNDRWLQSDWVAKRQHLRLDFGAGGAADLPRLEASAPLPRIVPPPPLNLIEKEERNGQVYRADIVVNEESFLLFKMTYHSNWQAVVDGQPQPTFMLSPGFIGVAVPSGKHEVEFRYRPEWWKVPLLFLGLVTVLLAAVLERKGVVKRNLEHIHAWSQRVFDLKTRGYRVRWLTVAGLLVLALPVCLPLLTNELPGGHDTFEYLPRQVEFHENIRHGILLPRWAPDLSAGYGQPFFLFNPPLLYYFAELWHLVGFDFVTALNLACVVLIALSGVSMFLLGALFFGATGGWLAAVAYVYAPYFHVNLYVRHALAEFAAFPFYPLALYGFARYARDGRRRFLLVGSIGYAGVLVSHHPAALLFTILLIAFIAFLAWQASNWNLLWRQLGGVFLGLGLSAGIWLPSLLEMQSVSVGLLLEGYLNYSNHFVYL